jgi:hypothetical protein
VERYESLRERTLGARPDGYRLGLGVLLSRGVACWMLTWRERAPAQLASPSSPLPAPVDEADEEIVRVLAAMAFACAGEA